MDGAFIDLAIKKLQWFLDHSEVTWSGIGIYALSLTGSAVLVVVACVRRRKKKSPPPSEEHLRQPLPAQNITNQFNNTGGEQTNLQGDHGIAKLINNYNNISPDALADVRKLAVTESALSSFFNNISPDALADVRKLAVTESALSSFFNILQREQMPSWELDSKLREIAFRYKELLLRFERRHVR